MATNINGVFKIRRGTNAALASVVLLDGQIGYSTDTKVIKVGDGVTPWSGLIETVAPACGMIYDTTTRSYQDSTGSGLDIIFALSTNITGTTVGTNSLVIQSAGTYEIACNLSVSFPVATTNYIFSVTKNGNKIPGIIYDTASISTGRYLSVSMGGIATLNSNDIIKVFFESSAPADVISVSHVNLYLNKII